MTEAIARTAEAEWKQALAVERETMLEELERIIPQIGGPAEAPTEETQPTVSEAPIQDAVFEKPDISTEVQKAPGLRDRSGSPPKSRRSGRSEKKRAKAFEGSASASQVDDQNPPPVPTETQALALQEPRPRLVSPTPTVELGEESKAISPTAISQVQKEIWSPWMSSARARQWLESLQTDGSARRWLDRHRSDLYLAAAIVMLVLSIGLLVRSPQPAAVQSKNPPQPALSLFERILVALDLAEPPTTQVFTGNPNTMVWVDLHTALYYCPGAELYGKTGGGKFTTQRDAQIDQFQPAERKSCN
jgi:hypothetical protein